MKTYDKVLVGVLAVFLVISVWMAFEVSCSLQWSDDQFAQQLLSEILFNQQDHYLRHKEYTDLDHIYLGYLEEKYKPWKLGNPVIADNHFVLKNYDFKGYLSRDKKRFLVEAKGIKNPERVIYITQDSINIANGRFKFFYGRPAIWED
ncbi:MAG: hypothetical protein KA419_14075 [Acidobacteria bacterium]|nr:hypothetical protein [Acidobacteriota bacterium]